MAPEVDWGAREKLRLVHSDLPRVDGPAKVSGKACYTSDVRLPGMVYARLVCCPLGRAKATIDTAPALALEGVVAAEVLREDTRYLGQPVAVVAAETPERAEDAARALAIEWEALPWALDAEQALAPDAPQVGRRGNRREGKPRGELEKVDAALEGCETVVDAVYTTPVQYHTSLEAHGVVVDYRGGDEATVYASTQNTFGVHGDAPDGLDLSASKVRVIVHHMGGGFGSKLAGLDIPGKHACRLAKQLKRPVHLMLDRTQELTCAGNRSGTRQHLVAGATKADGIVALKSDVEAYGGLGGASTPRHPFLYDVPLYHRKSATVYTNWDGTRPMRAPGHPEASFAMESLVDELAYGLEADLVAFRKQLVGEGAFARQLDRVAREIGWAEHPHKTAPGGHDGWEAVGIGFGLSTWGGGGMGGSQVDVRVERDGSVSASIGSQDLGTGTRTYIAAIVAEELGLELADVEARIGDSRMGNSCMSGGSMTSPSVAPVVKDAAVKLRAELAARAAELFECAPEEVRFEGRQVATSGGQQPLAWKSFCEALPAQGLSVRGDDRHELYSGGTHCTQAARVRVDLLTGRVRVEMMVALQECGLALNTLAARSQINGGMLMGLGYALLEERLCDRELGLMLNSDLEGYKLVGSLEVPELVALIDEDDQRQKVIGIGEPPAIPGAGAIANAVANACGVRVRDLPLTPDKVLMGLEELRG